MERMIKAGCAATSDFEWLSQLRFVFSREDGPYGICSVRQTNCQLEYSYEYQASAVGIGIQTMTISQLVQEISREFGSRYA